MDLLGPCSGFVFISFTIRITKQHPVNISFPKKVQQIREVQLVLPCLSIKIEHRYPCFIAE